MKITKGQLKRIIAQEHAVVYGKKPRRKTKRQLLEERKLQKRKQSLHAKYQAALIVETMRSHDGSEVVLEEGFFGELFGGAASVVKKAFQMGGEQASKIGSAASSAAGKLGKAWEEGTKAVKDKNIENARNKLTDDFLKDQAMAMFEDFMADAMEELISAGMDSSAVVAELTGRLQVAMQNAAGDGKWEDARKKAISELEKAKDEEASNAKTVKADEDPDKTVKATEDPQGK